MCIVIDCCENCREVADKPWPLTKMFVNTACNLRKSDNYNHESKEYLFDKSFYVNGWQTVFARIALADRTDDNFFGHLTWPVRMAGNFFRTDNSIRAHGSQFFSNRWLDHCAQEAIFFGWITWSEHTARYFFRTDDLICAHSSLLFSNGWLDPCARFTNFFGWIMHGLRMAICVKKANRKERFRMRGDIL